jgi:hypothetical protein
MGTYTIINRDGTVKGTQTLLDTMADRLEAQGYTLVPAASVPTIKVTFGRKPRRRPQHA